MSLMLPKANRYLGMRPGDLDQKPYARFWNPHMAPLAAHAQTAVAHGPVAPPLMAESAETVASWRRGDSILENGFALMPNGALHVAICTEFPGATPGMIDWWFGWHSAEPQRYKLWYPDAHVYAVWRDPRPPGLRGRERYVGRASIVDEYLGSDIGRYNIAFIPAAEMGLSDLASEAQDTETAVCARLGLGDAPLDAGYLMHYVRKNDRGCLMHSRFWLGPPFVGVRGTPSSASSRGKPKSFLIKPRESDGRSLLVHCAMEMHHLAEFLPAIYSEFWDGD